MRSHFFAAVNMFTFMSLGTQAANLSGPFDQLPALEDHQSFDNLLAEVDSSALSWLEADEAYGQDLLAQLLAEVENELEVENSKETERDAVYGI